MKRLKRAQPRSKTPPVSLRGESTGERVVLMLDESHVTTERSASTSRQPIFLRLGAGLTVKVGSRKVNKRRYPLLTICIAGVILTAGHVFDLFLLGLNPRESDGFELALGVEIDHRAFTEIETVDVAVIDQRDALAF
jgi:hypothetical protein